MEHNKTQSEEEKEGLPANGVNERGEKKDVLVPFFSSSSFQVRST